MAVAYLSATRSPGSVHHSAGRNYLMVDSPPGWYPDHGHPGNDRYWDGSAWTDDYRPSAVSASPSYTVVVAPTRTTPGIVTTAFVFSLLGFCGITALIGLVLGLAGRGQAKRAGAGVGLATASIVISLLWIVPPLIIWIVAGVLVANTPSSISAPRPTPAVSTPATPLAPSAAPDTNGTRLVVALEKKGFGCTEPSGPVQLIQCRKGTVKVPVYGTQPKELVNITLQDPTDGEVIDGYVLPSTAKALRPFGVKSDGNPDDQGAVLIYN